MLGVLSISLKTGLARRLFSDSEFALVDFASDVDVRIADFLLKDEFIGTNIPRTRSGHCDGRFPGRDRGSTQSRWRRICPIAADGRAPLHYHCSDLGARKIEIPGGCQAFVARREPAFADLGIDLGRHVYLAAHLSELGIRVVL